MFSIYIHEWWCKRCLWIWTRGQFSRTISTWTWNREHRQARLRSGIVQDGGVVRESLPEDVCTPNIILRLVMTGTAVIWLAELHSSDIGFWSFARVLPDIAQKQIAVGTHLASPEFVNDVGLEKMLAFPLDPFARHTALSFSSQRKTSIAIEHCWSVHCCS